MRRLKPGDDLVEHLYLGWMHEPYHRASLAIAVKIIDVLERDLALRRRGADVLTRREFNEALDWLNRTLAGDWTPRASDFRLSPADSGSDSLHGAGFFAFADRTTFTQRDRWMGDFDVLACAGFRVYPVGRHRPLQPEDVHALQAHAAALGVVLLDAPLPYGAARPGGVFDLGDALHPVSLREILTQPDGLPNGAAVVDPPGGEPWSGLIARRALLRGVTGTGPIAMGGVPPAEASGDRPAGMRAAMWGAALAGQRFGILEGWRDARDGTPTPYASELAHPAYLEVVAHTALDLLRFQKAWSPLVHRPGLAVIIGPEHLAAADGNAWSQELLAFTEALTANHIAFDLLAAGQGDLAAKEATYPVALRLDPLAGEGDADAVSLTYRVYGREMPPVTLPNTLGPRRWPALSDLLIVLLERHAPETLVVTVIEGGRPASQLFVQAAPSGDRVALVDFSGRARLVQVDRRGHRTTHWQDVLTHDQFDSAVPMTPFGVRLLVADGTRSR